MLGGPLERSGFPPPSGGFTPSRCGLLLLRRSQSYLRLAPKSQAQCRATLETLAEIKNPPTLFAQQANVAHGPQQVNNNPPSSCDHEAHERGESENRTKRTIGDS